MRSQFLFLASDEEQTEVDGPAVDDTDRPPESRIKNL